MKILFMILFQALMILSFAQNNDFPVTPYKGNDSNKPLVFYLTGDGGWNSFSNSLVNGLNKNGYTVLGLNSRSYFWKKKTPEQLSSNVAATVEHYMKIWNLKSFVLIGYSFGADVTPFIETRLSKNQTETLKKIILMSVSKTTDFEIHVLGMIGLGSHDGSDVVSEINKVQQPITMIFGSDEKQFPLNRIKNKNATILSLEGGHHYDGNVDELIKTIINQMR